MPWHGHELYCTVVYCTVLNCTLSLTLQAPCFLFVDEIDALAGKNVVRSGDREAVFQEFLNELDGR